MTYQGPGTAPYQQPYQQPQPVVLQNAANALGGSVQPNLPEIAPMSPVLDTSSFNQPAPSGGFKLTPKHISGLLAAAQALQSLGANSTQMKQLGAAYGAANAFNRSSTASDAAKALSGGGESKLTPEGQAGPTNETTTYTKNADGTYTETVKRTGNAANTKPQYMSVQDLLGGSGNP